MLPPAIDPDASIPALLGRLVELLRAPVPAPDLVRDTVAVLAARVKEQPSVIEAGIENSWALDGDPLKGRLQARILRPHAVLGPDIRGHGIGRLVAVVLPVHARARVDAEV